MKSALQYSELRDLGLKGALELKGYLGLKGDRGLKRDLGLKGDRLGLKGLRL